MSLNVTLYKELKKENIADLETDDMAKVYENYANYLYYDYNDDKKLSINDWYIKNRFNIISLYSSNITHNLNIMADKAGIYKALWRPYKLTDGYDENKFDEADYDAEYKYEQSQIIHAKDVSSIIEEGLKKLKDKPEYYKQFDSENGWGLYIHFVPFVEKYLKALKEYPNAIINIGR